MDSSARAQQPLTMVVLEDLSEAQVRRLMRMDLDIAAIPEDRSVTGPSGAPERRVQMDLVVSEQDKQKLRTAGMVWREPIRPSLYAGRRRGRTGLPVYRDFDTSDIGLRDQLYALERDYPGLVDVQVIGRSHQDRPILALRLTNEELGGAKPEVLFLHTAHAREWVSPDFALRLIRYLLHNYGSLDRVTGLLDDTAFWIIPVQNPDGYQYTHERERLWRKNLRDNDGDGVITRSDGVDLNRNFGSHWGIDDEGSSGATSSPVYRGPAPASEPETQAVVDLMLSRDFQFNVSYHSYGNLILYPEGWQVKTPSLDDAIFVAQAGTDGNPAIYDSIVGRGYDPGVGADLYITNGEFNDWAYQIAGVPGHTVELSAGRTANWRFYGFEFPADEALLQQLFEDNLEFALSVIESAKDSAHPVSPVGIETQDVYHEPVTEAYGADQQIIVVARRGLELELRYTRAPADGDDDDNDGESEEADFVEQLGQFYHTQPGVHYSRYVATVEDQNPGDTIRYQIMVDERVVESHAYRVAQASRNRVLVLAAEDYTGRYPRYEDSSGPNYLHYYTQALEAGGYSYDVWDVDAQGIPEYQDVLSHYHTVVWYTGDDFVATSPAGFDTHQLETLQLRELLNYGDGRLFVTGQGVSYLPALAYWYSDDFWQYHIGAMRHLEAAGVDPIARRPWPVQGIANDPILGGLRFELTGGDGASNQRAPDSFLANLDPRLGVQVAGRYEQEGNPLEPRSGAYYVYSGREDASYKRLGGTFTIAAGNPHLRVFASYEIEPSWDFAFVELSVVGSGVWTTLPDSHGATTQDTGSACRAGWVRWLHPFLAHYVDEGCNPSGSTGQWHAITGRSQGWREIDVDLSAYAGQTVELYISYASDWGVQQRGVLLDDIQLDGYATESFETGYGLWNPQPGPDAQPTNNWNRLSAGSFPEGAALRTRNTVFLGFGLEGIATAEDRARVMDRALRYLGRAGD